MEYLELNEENIKKIAEEVINHTYYGDEKKIIHDVLNRFKYNTDLNEIAIKIAVVDLTSSTHLSQHKEKISLYELANHILHIPNFDKRVEDGDINLVREIAECNGKVNLFSFATKYCTYHNFEIYNKDCYSIYDGIVKEMLPYYSEKVTKYQIDKWRKTYDYEAFHKCIGDLLKDIHMDYPRRMFDYFLWYPNRKK